MAQVAPPDTAGVPTPNGAVTPQDAVIFDLAAVVSAAIQGGAEKMVSAVPGAADLLAR